MSQLVDRVLSALVLLATGCLVDTVGQDPDRLRGGEGPEGGRDVASGAGGQGGDPTGGTDAGAGGAGAEAQVFTYEEKRCAAGEVGLSFEVVGDELRLVCGAPDLRNAGASIDERCQLRFGSVSENGSDGAIGASQAVARGRSCFGRDGDPLEGCQPFTLGSALYNVARVAVETYGLAVSRTFEVDFECDGSPQELGCDDASRVLTGRSEGGAGVCHSLESLVGAAAVTDCKFSFGADPDGADGLPSYWGTSSSTGCEASVGASCAEDGTAVIPWAGLNGTWFSSGFVSAGFVCVSDAEDIDTEFEDQCPEGWWVVGQTSKGALKCEPVGAELADVYAACRPFVMADLNCHADGSSCWGSVLYDGQTSFDRSNYEPYNFAWVEQVEASPSPVIIHPGYDLGNDQQANNIDYVGVGFRCTP